MSTDHTAEDLTSRLSSARDRLLDKSAVAAELAAVAAVQEEELVAQWLVRAANAYAATASLVPACSSHVPVPERDVWED